MRKGKQECFPFMVAAFSLFGISQGSVKSLPKH
jgi:hypothetical protein